MINITDEPINPAKVYELLNKNSSGSVVLHYAIVKPLAGAGGMTSFIDYSANADCEAELSEIAADLAAEFSIEDILLIRRTGRLGLGEIISLIAASAPGSEEAFEACKRGIGRLKKMKTIVKNEVCSKGR